MDVNECSPADAKYINGRGKCRDCPNCHLGTGRNLTQAKLQRSLLDNRKCLPCEPCPPGTFNNQLGFTTECRPCTETMCSSLYRDVQIQCTSHSDYVCGSCQSGFYDFFKDTKHACSRISTQPTTPYPHPNTHSRIEKLPHVWQHGKAAAVEKGASVTSLTYAPMIVGILGLIFLVVVVIAVLVYKRRRGCRDTIRTVEHGNCVPGQSSSTLTSSGSECSSLLLSYEATQKLGLLQTDGPGDTVGKKLAQYDDDVRGELNSFNIQSSTVGGLPIYNQTNSPAITYKDFERKCRCHESLCGEGCRPSSLDSTVAKRGDELLSSIAYGICHDPTSLFRDLRMPDAEVYNLDDNRKRSPETISQRQFILSVLQRWVELQGRFAVYGQLRQALCDNGFHRINDNVLIP